MAEDIITPDEAIAIGLGAVETRSAARVADTDFGQRIITVVAVPYEEMTQAPFRGEMWNEVFTRGSFEGLDARKRRIPVSAALDVPDLGHSNGKLVGKIVDAYPDREEGLVTDVKISRTAQGDDTLQLAHDEALSASVGFAVKNRFDQQIDRVHKVRRIGRAFLHHLSFVAEPAYNGARVLAMRSTTTGEPIAQDGATPLLDEFLEDEFFTNMLKRVRS